MMRWECLMRRIRMETVQELGTPCRGQWSGMLLTFVSFSGGSVYRNEWVSEFREGGQWDQNMHKSAISLLC